MKRLLKLHPHIHTGRLLHHRHTSYRALLVVFLVAGLFMVFTSQAARALDLEVSATVPAPIPSGAPTFTYPADGAVVSNPDVDFAGTCPIITPAVMIELRDGASLLGSTPCQSDGTFALTATIAAGTRSIVATVVTITGGTGQSSSPLTITYNPPTPPPTTPPTSPQPTPTPRPPVGTGRTLVAPLDIIAETSFVRFSHNSPAVWKGTFQGGNQPYTVIIDWGDGSDPERHTRVGSTSQTYLHTYDAQVAYEVTITVTDQSAQSLTRRYAAVSLSPQIITTGISRPTSDSWLNGWPADENFNLYVTYGALFVLTLLLWRLEHLLLPPKVQPIPVTHRRLRHR